MKLLKMESANSPLKNVLLSSKIWTQIVKMRISHNQNWAKNKTHSKWVRRLGPWTSCKSMTQLTIQSPKWPVNFRPETNLQQMLMLTLWPMKCHKAFNGWKKNLTSCLRKLWVSRPVESELPPSMEISWTHGAWFLWLSKRATICGLSNLRCNLSIR